MGGGKGGIATFDRLSGILCLGLAKTGCLKIFQVFIADYQSVICPVLGLVKDIVTLVLGLWLDKLILPFASFISATPRSFG